MPATHLRHKQALKELLADDQAPTETNFAVAVTNSL